MPETVSWKRNLSAAIVEPCLSSCFQTIFHEGRACRYLELVHCGPTIITRNALELRETSFSCFFISGYLIFLTVKLVYFINAAFLLFKTYNQGQYKQIHYKRNIFIYVLLRIKLYLISRFALVGGFGRLTNVRHCERFL